MANAQVDAFKASVSQATGSFLPQLYANAGYTRYEEPNIITPIHQLGVFPPLDDEIYEATFLTLETLVTAALDRLFQEEGK